jgi:hypothetical protein
MGAMLSALQTQLVEIFDSERNKYRLAIAEGFNYRQELIENQKRGYAVPFVDTDN